MTLSYEQLANLARHTFIETMNTYGEKPDIGERLMNNIAAVYGIPSVPMPLPPVDPTTLTSVEAFDTALDPIMDRWVQGCTELAGWMGDNAVPIIKALETSPMDDTYKDAIVKRLAKRLEEGAHAMEKLFDAYE